MPQEQLAALPSLRRSPLPPLGAVLRNHLANMRVLAERNAQADAPASPPGKPRAKDHRQAGKQAKSGADQVRTKSVKALQMLQCGSSLWLTARARILGGHACVLCSPRAAGETS